MCNLEGTALYELEINSNHGEQLIAYVDVSSGNDAEKVEDEVPSYWCSMKTLR